MIYEEKLEIKKIVVWFGYFSMHIALKLTNVFGKCLHYVRKLCWHCQRVNFFFFNLHMFLMFLCRQHGIDLVRLH